MTTESNRPVAASESTLAGDETVALARHRSAVTKRLTRKKTERRIEELQALRPAPNPTSAAKP